MKRTTTQKKLTPKLKEIKELLAEEEDYLRPLVGLVVQEVLEAEMSEEQIEHPNLTSQFSEDAPVSRYTTFDNISS
jgi:hypothetical protein